MFDTNGDWKVDYPLTLGAKFRREQTEKYQKSKQAASQKQIKPKNKWLKKFSLYSSSNS